MRKADSRARAECYKLFISKTFTMNLFLSPNSRRSSHNLFHYLFSMFFCSFVTDIAVTAVINVSTGARS